MLSLVALDLETTGLDPQTDSIIEIGAIRFNSRRVESEWTNLINPGRRIPPFITQLTGITDQMVMESPPIHAVLSDLKDFVGDAIVVGHNIGFDLAFLSKQGILRQNDRIDTYEMASILLPSAGRYNLAALGQALGVPLSATHRALDDARVTRALFLRLYEMALEIPLQLLAEIVRLGESTDWGGYRAFYEALRARHNESISHHQVSQAITNPIFDGYTIRNLPPLSPNKDTYPLDPDEVSAILEIGGEFSRHFPTYEFRPQQDAYLVEVDGKKQIAGLTHLDPILYALDNRYYSIGQPIGVGYKETKR